MIRQDSAAIGSELKAKNLSAWDGEAAKPFGRGRIPKGEGSFAGAGFRPGRRQGTAIGRKGQHLGASHVALELDSFLARGGVKKHHGSRPVRSRGDGETVR